MGTVILRYFETYFNGIYVEVICLKLAFARCKNRNYGNYPDGYFNIGQKYDDDLPLRLANFVPGGYKTEKL